MTENTKDSHWLPRQGEPMNTLECASQKAIKILAWLPVYTAIIVTLVLLVQIFGIPFIGVDHG